ncbi:ATP-dependent DNA helicase sgs1 [Ceratobasidium sp. 392]|nr:ATP-dependent DNA helicase sgs1 [Ceratobasidium sp. 392]
MSSRSESPPPGPPNSFNIDEMRARIVEETISRTGHTPQSWQLDDALKRLSGKDTFTIAATGAGKSLTFAMIAFVLEHTSITWVLAPLIVIQEQQARVFNDEWKVPSLYLNSSVEQAKANILAGEYQIVISSPENFFDANKLRKVVMSAELSRRQHFVVVDEAHVIHTWGGQFRTAYGNCGNLRAMLLNVPFSAVTATATQSVKEAVISALHLGSSRPFVFTNVGNYRKNIKYLLYIMKGGLNSFQKIAALIALHGRVPTLVFTDAIANTQRIADVIRSELSWTGGFAQNIIAYHSLRDESGKRDGVH